MKIMTRLMIIAFLFVASAGWCRIVEITSTNGYLDFGGPVKATNASFTGGIDVSGLVRGANASFTGFIGMGDTGPYHGVRFKTVGGTTGGTEGDTSTVAHGLTSSRILWLQSVVIYGTSPNTGMFPGSVVAEYQYSADFDGTNVYLRLHATSSGSLLSKSFLVFIFYY